MELAIIGPVKVKDGIFMGDEYAAHDLDFLLANKVTHVINCAGGQVSNLFYTMGIQYLTFSWKDLENENYFDQKDEITKQIYNFINKSQDLGEACLIHSLRGQARAYIFGLLKKVLNLLNDAKRIQIQQNCKQAKLEIFRPDFHKKNKKFIKISNHQQ